jgi:phosphoribosylaminoimidazole-succinocarboxamide synthase
MTTSREVILESHFPLPLLARGKVRDIYEVGGSLLIVATDRISAFDYILGSGIPRKGEVLNRLSLFWFDYLRDIIPNHLLTADVDSYPAMLRAHAAQLRGRSMLVNRAEMIQVECVARGYLSGSGWNEYRETGSVCGIPLPAGLRESDRLPEPIFTPATKADTGHDQNISFERMTELVDPEVAERLRSTTLQIYRKAARYAETKGILVADTKLEFGFVEKKLVLADEVLTPDSSRFWPMSEYRPGGPQPSYDKQFVRDYLESIRWNKQPPAPVLADDVVERTSVKYREAYRLLTGVEL